MAESLLSPSGVKLFGRPFAALTLTGRIAGLSPLGATAFLFQQLNQEEATWPGSMHLRMRAIYISCRSRMSFSCMVTACRWSSPEAPRTAVHPPTVDHWGVVAKIDRFADDVSVWDYDKEDFPCGLTLSGAAERDRAGAGDGRGQQHLARRHDLAGQHGAAGNMAGNGGGSTDMAARANLAVRHRFTR